MFCRLSFHVCGLWRDLYSAFNCRPTWGALWLEQNTQWIVSFEHFIMTSCVVSWFHKATFGDWHQLWSAMLKRTCYFLSVCKPCDSRRNKHFCLQELGLAFIHYHSGWYWASKCDCSDQHCNWKKPEKCLCNHKKGYQKLHSS